MSERFSVAIREWLASSSESAVEGATNAEVGITIGENCVTQVEDFESKTLRSTIRVAAEPIAKWLLANWWRLRWETEPGLANETLPWAMAHSVAAIGGGYVWPDLVFRGSDGLNISIECKANISATKEAFSPIRFLNSFSSVISASEFEGETRSFVEKVIARLHAVGIRKSELHDLWKDLQAEWSNPKFTSYRKTEAFLGLEPDEDDGLVSSVVKWNRQFGQGAVEEISAASYKSDVLQRLSEAKLAAQSVRTYADIPNLDQYSIAPNGYRVGDLAPWQIAQAFAYNLRKAWGFGSGPISDRDLAERLSLPEAKLREVKPQAPFSFGWRGEAGRKLGFVLNRGYDHGRRFDTARLIGDYLSVESTDRVTPATTSMTSRQKFQRAFAAEFLCPSEMLEERYPNGIDRRSIDKVLEEVSDEYNVSKQVVLHHVENRGIFSGEFINSPLLLA